VPDVLDAVNPAARGRPAALTAPLPPWVVWLSGLAPRTAESQPYGRGELHTSRGIDGPLHRYAA